jgi:hypothetical protein
MAPSHAPPDGGRLLVARCGSAGQKSHIPSAPGREPPLNYHNKIPNSASFGFKYKRNRNPSKPSTLEQIGISNNRQILYTHAWENHHALDQLPKDHWLAFFIGDDKHLDTYSKLASKCLANNVLYVCTAGQCCEYIHDIFDEVIVWNEIEGDQNIDNLNHLETSPLTTWHHHFYEGLWFAITTAHHESKPIDKVVCLDFTRQGVKGHLTHLIEKANAHELPSDDEFEMPIYDTP